jgi:methionyl-tRNA synthetase
MSPERILVTSALPYANGPIHLGHLAGAYLPADIYVRFQRLKKRDVVYICGTDEHGVPITIRADAEGVSPRDIVDRYYEDIRGSFEGLGISFDNFSRTTLPHHYKIAQDFFLNIYNKGYIFEKTITQFFCPTCNRFLADRYVNGECPYCHSAGARGDSCEECGKWLEPSVLIHPSCAMCGSTPEPRETKHWFFKLSALQERLQQWISTKTHWKDNVKRFCEGWFSEGLEDRSITRDLAWGVPVPLDDARGKVLYVWFDAPIGYISSTVEWAERNGNPDLWKKYWCEESTKLVHFIGKDNIVFHAMVWPAMLMAHSGFVLPAEIPANEFLNIEGEKISTSRNWAIWLPEYLKKYEADPLRYCLASNSPETRDSDFTWPDYQRRNNNELADIFGNFVNRTLTFIEKYFRSRIPEGAGISGRDQEFLDRLSAEPERVGDLLERFEAKKALRRVLNLAKDANRYFDAKQPWSTRKTDSGDCANTMFVCASTAETLSLLLEPFMPFTSEKIGQMLGVRRESWDETSPVQGGIQMGKAEILFHKIEDEAIEAERAKLKKGGEKMEEVTIDDFGRMDLRVARVLEVEKVEGSKNLLKIQIDIGDEKRQIVASIAQQYSPEDLKGRDIVVIVNLKPAKIRGTESCGMLLAAEKGEDVVLVVPDRKIDIGSKVH